MKKILNRRAAVVAVGSLSAAVAFSLYGVAGAASSNPGTSQAPPPVPNMVNPDGSLNLSYFKGVHTWEPPGYKGPHHYITPNDYVAPTLTPSQVMKLSPAERAKLNVQIAP